MIIFFAIDDPAVLCSAGREGRGGREGEGQGGRGKEGEGEGGAMEGMKGKG